MQRPPFHELERVPVPPKPDTGGRRTHTRWRSEGVLGLACCLAGCQSVLGIEELSEAPRPGVVDPGGAGGGGAGGSSAGGSSAGASNAGAGGGSVSGGSGGSEVGGSGGSAGTPPDAGMIDPGGPITVSGHIVDFYLRPASGLHVNIGAEEAITGDNGEFTIQGVVPPYDVSLIAQSPQGSFNFRYYAYVYQGLTRADPTLQVYYGRPERGSTVNLTLSNAAFTDDTERVSLAFSNTDGYFAAPSINFATPSLYPGWSGPTSTAGNVHALRMTLSSSATGAPPLAYLAYETTPLAVTDEVTSNLSLDMSPEVIQTATLTGSIDAGSFATVTHLVAARFADGTALPLINTESTQPAFSYLVPSLPNASLTVAASASSPGGSIVHVDNVPAAAAQNVTLALPRPVAPSAPGSGANVGPGSTFAWSTVGQSAQVFVWHLESGGYFEGVYVITARSEIEFPVVPGYTFTPLDPGDDPSYWFVETHGDYPSVDAAAGPQGMFDSFAFEKNIGTGVTRGSQGYYTISDSRIVNLVTAQ